MQTSVVNPGGVEESDPLGFDAENAARRSDLHETPGTAVPLD